MITIQILLSGEYRFCTIYKSGDNAANDNPKQTTPSEALRRHNSRFVTTAPLKQLKRARSCHQTELESIVSGKITSICR